MRVIIRYRKMGRVDMARKIRQSIKQALQSKKRLRTGQSGPSMQLHDDHFIPPQIIFITHQDEDDQRAEDSWLDEMPLSEESPVDFEPLPEDEESFALTETPAVLEEPQVSATEKIQVAFLIKDQVESIKSLVEKIRHLETNIYKEAVVDALLAKLEINELETINHYTEMKSESDNEISIALLCDVCHKLFLIGADKLSVIRLYSHLNKIESLPYNIARTNQLVVLFNTLLKHENNSDVQNRLKQVLNTLNLNIYFETYLENISKLYALDLSNYEAEVLDLIASENPVIINIINSASLPLSIADIESIKLTFQSLKENISSLASTLFEMLFNAVDNNTIKKYKILADLVNKQCNDLDLLVMLDRLLTTNVKQHGIAQIYTISHQLISTIDLLKDIIKNKTTAYSKTTSTFLLRFERGDFFNDNEFNLLKDAVYTLFSYVKPDQVIDNALFIFTRLNDSQKLNCLTFLHQFMMLDKKATAFSSKYEKSKIIERLNMFNHLVSSLNNNDEITSKLNDLSTLIIDKIIFKDQWFSQYLVKIHQGNIPPQEMLFRLNTINAQFTEVKDDIGMLEEQAIAVISMIESPRPWSTGNEVFTRSFQASLDLFIEHLASVKDLEATYQSLVKLRDDQHLSIVEEINLNDFTESNIDLLMRLKNIATQSLNANELNTLLEEFYKQINHGFLNRFRDIDLSELVNLNWDKDEERIKSKVMIKSPTIRKYLQYLNVNSKFIALSILYAVESIAHIEPRMKIQQIQSVHNFYEKLVKYALEKKNAVVAICINTALDMPYINRLNLSSNKHLRESLLNDLSSKALQTSNFINIVPPITEFLATISEVFNKPYKAEMEFYVMTGRKLKEIDRYQLLLFQSQEIQSDTTHTIYSVLNKLNLILQPYFYQDILINEKRIAELLKEVSMDMKPTIYETRSLSDFVSLAELKQHLLYCYNRNIDYLLQGSPKKEIITFVTEHINNEGISDFNDAIAILDLIQKIEVSQNRTYADYDQSLATILQPFHEKVAQSINSEHFSINELDTFFQAFNVHPRIQQIRDISKEKKPFSSVNDLKYIVKLIDDYYSEFKRKLLIQQEEKRQSTYSELLTKILEGGKQESFIPFKSVLSDEDHGHDSLLPETEYPVPLAEPEHPDYIGINKTMNFNPAPLPNSVLSIFETKELMQDFLVSFVWGAKIDKLQVLEAAKSNPSLNVLGIDNLYSPLVQLKVMSLVLVSLDAIGKIAGQNGGYAIHNFTAIKEINDRLSEITQVITSEYADDDIIITRCNRLTHAVYQLNHECFALLKESHAYPIEFNTTMNEFCHINEHLVHRLTGIDYRESVLTPISTQSNYYKKLSQRAKAEIPASALYEESDTKAHRKSPAQHQAHSLRKDSRDK